MENILNLNNKKNIDSQEDLRNEIVKNAYDILNRNPKPKYVWGKTGPDYYDCSGFTQTLFKKSGIDIPRVSYAQGDYVKRDMNKNNLKPGDLVFFETTGKKRISHVGVYIGDGKFIDSGGGGQNNNSPKKAGYGVRISDLNSKYWSRTFRGGASLEKIVEKNIEENKKSNKMKSNIRKYSDNSESTLTFNISNKNSDKIPDYRPIKNLAERMKEAKLSSKDNSEEVVSTKKIEDNTKGRGR